MSRTFAECREDVEERGSRSNQDSEHVTIQTQQKAWHHSRGYKEVISTEAQIYLIVTTFAVTSLMAEMVVVGASWVFAPIYAAVIGSYIVGALSLFKKLMTF